MVDYCPLCLEEDGLRIFSSPVCMYRLNYHLTCYLKSNERYGCLACRQRWQRSRYYHLFIFALLLGCLYDIQPYAYPSFYSWLVVCVFAIVSLGRCLLVGYSGSALYNRIGELVLLTTTSFVLQPITLILFGAGGCASDLVIDYLIYSI